jgi:hypothetical protein
VAAGGRPGRKRELVVRALCRVKEKRDSSGDEGCRVGCARSEDLVVRSLDPRFAACIDLGCRRLVGKCSVSQTPITKSPDVDTLSVQKHIHS